MKESKHSIVLNRMYAGTYLSTNLGHEVTNMFQADDQNSLKENVTKEIKLANHIVTLFKIRYFNMRVLITTFVFFLLILPCLAQHQYEIHYLSETDKSIQLTVIVSNVKEKQATAYACSDAGHALLFNGIEGSRSRRLPYIHDENESYEKHAAYYHDIFDNGGFWSFIIASSIIEKGKTKDKEKYYLVNINISLKALKESLIKHNVIRRFGV